MPAPAVAADSGRSRRRSLQDAGPLPAVVSTAALPPVQRKRAKLECLVEAPMAAAADVATNLRRRSSGAKLGPNLPPLAVVKPVAVALKGRYLNINAASAASEAGVDAATTNPNWHSSNVRPGPVLQRRKAEELRTRISKAGGDFADATDPDAAGSDATQSNLSRMTRGKYTKSSATSLATTTKLNKKNVEEEIDDLEDLMAAPPTSKAPTFNAKARTAAVSSKRNRISSSHEEETQEAIAKFRKKAQRSFASSQSFSSSSSQASSTLQLQQNTTPMNATSKEASQFVAKISTWYSKVQRDLPWRPAPNRIVTPYMTWVSEIMCQQTRVDTVISYFHNFMCEFPTVKKLADADLDKVNRVWAGLGYYRRAKLLHEGAKQVVDKHGGEVPTKYEELLELKGVGAYTAGAIASIAFGERVPAIDGNAVRVFSRWRAYDEFDAKSSALSKRITQLSRELVVLSDKPGDFNQAVMELGATVCKPRTPTCEECPIRETCRSVQVLKLTPTEIAARFPKPAVKKTRKIVVEDVDDEVDENEEATEGGKVSKRSSSAVSASGRIVPILIGVVRREGHVLAVQRPSDVGLLASQWELVCVEGFDVELLEPQLKQSNTEKALVDRMSSLGACNQCVANAKVHVHVGSFTHIFSHLKHRCSVVVVDLGEKTCKSNCGWASSITGVGNLKWIPLKDFKSHGLSRSMTKALELIVIEN